MKYLFVLLFPFFCFAQDFAGEDVRLLMKLCEIEEPNVKLFMKSATPAQKACMASKIAESKQIIADDKKKVKDSKDARERLSQYDCSTMTGFLKDLCLANGGK